MPRDSTSPARALKEWFNEDRYRKIARSLARASPKFDQDQFLQLTLHGLAGRELMDRVRQTAVAAHAALRGTYRKKLAVLRQAAPDETHGFIGVWFSDFVGQFGRSCPEVSLPALRYFTRFGSAEFAIREFILQDPIPTLTVMREWADDDNEHVRRLASEGSRPRLPWGKRIALLVENPRPTRGILEALKDDRSLYVRKSVANHLNDISKDHPETMLEWVKRWKPPTARTTWIIKQGLRTLIKQGHPGAMALMGARRPRLVITQFALGSSSLQLGDTLNLRARFRSNSRRPQKLIVDYVVHYVKANGRCQPKVFKWKIIELAAGESVKLVKRQVMRDFSTRRHYAGEHRVELQINGQRLNSVKFRLEC